MRNYVVWLVAAAVLALCAPAASAQEKPEHIESLVKRTMPHDWYVKQAKLWREVIDKDHHNADAWLNYFVASRYSGFDASADQKAQGQLMERIVKEMEVAIPNTFEYNYVRWWNGGNESELFPYLQKAYEMRPDYKQLADDFISYYELAGNQEQVKFFSRKWFETQDMPEALLSYSYNVLMSLEKNAVLVTSGDLDTYPLWVLQYAKGIRTDVTVLNQGLVDEPKYRARVLKDHDIGGDASIEQGPEFFRSVAEGNTRRPVYFALTVDPALTEQIKDNLYTVGLANRYSPKRIDNIALLKKNWQNFRLDYLKLDFYAEQASFSQQMTGNLNMNYVVPAYLLYEHYTISGEQERAAAYRDLALGIGRAGGQEDAVRNYFDGVEDGTTPDGSALGKSSNALSPEDADWSRQVVVAPNPATTELTVQLPAAGDADLELADIQGNVVRNQKLQAGEAKMDLTGLSSGPYVLRVNAGAHSATKPVRIVR